MYFQSRLLAHTHLSKVRPAAGTLSIRPFSSSRIAFKPEGSSSDDHVTKTNDTHNVQKEASESGQMERAKGGGNSQAMSETDHGNSNEKAQREHPEAPGPVIGMNDERGGKGH